jgi:nitrite reductase/ring-hydroxylating ferredoxin subunit/predicted enzyme related to lactoylglutathione lyase
LCGAHLAGARSENRISVEPGTVHYGGLSTYGIRGDHTTARIRHIEIRSANVEETAKFFIDVFDLQLQWRHNRGMLILSDGEITLHVTPLDTPGAQPGFDHIGFEVDDFEETQRRVAAHNGRQLHPMTQEPVDFTPLPRIDLGEGKSKTLSRNTPFESPEGFMVEVGQWRTRLFGKDEGATGRPLRVCPLDELPPGAMTWIGHGSGEIAVANVNGDLCAMDNVCPHAGGSLAAGVLRGSAVICPQHNRVFDFKSGACQQDRNLRLTTYPVVVEDETVFVEVPSRANVS